MEKSTTRRNRRRVPGEELALLSLAVLTIVVPGLWRGVWSGRAEGVEISHASFSLEPLAIDVETAPWYEWCLLDGIGETRARRIVEFVSTNQPLASPELLQMVPGLPAGWFEGARPFLRFRGRPVELSPRGVESRENADSRQSKESEASCD